MRTLVLVLVLVLGIAISSEASAAAPVEASCDHSKEPCCPLYYGPVYGWDEDDLKACGFVGGV